MPWVNSDVIARIVQILGPGDGLFVYVPETVDLAESIAPAAGSDEYGNSYVDGFTVYKDKAVLQLHINPSQDIPAIEMPTGAPVETGHASVYTWAVNQGAANEFIETAINGPTAAFDNQNAQIFLTTFSADGSGDTAIDFRVGKTGKAYIDAKGTHFPAPVYGTGGILAIGDAAVSVQPGTASIPETWHYPALPSGWTGLLRYRLTPRNETEIQCDITGSAAATGSIPLFTLPVSAYFPAVQAHFPLRVFCPNAPVNTEISGNVTTSGAVIALNIPAGTTNIAFCQAVPLEGTS